MRRIIQLLIFIVPISLFSQFSKTFTNVSEYRFSNSLLDAIDSKSYNYGVTMLDSILVYTNSPDKSIIENGIICCLKTFKKDKLHQLLEIAEYNNYSLFSIKEDIKLVFPEILTLHESLFVQKKDSVQLFSIAQQLAQMFVDDQVCRSTFYESFVKHSEQLGYKILVDHSKSGREVDSINTILLDTILANHPKLSKKDIGTWGMISVTAIIQHSNRMNLKKYKPFMDRWLEGGDITRSEYALYIDRLLFFEDKPQIYGTQLKRTNEGVVFYPIENIDKIETLRMKMGLTSIKKYAQHFGINWNEYYQNQKKIDYRP